MVDLTSTQFVQLEGGSKVANHLWGHDDSHPSPFVAMRHHPIASLSFFLEHKTLQRRGETRLALQSWFFGGSSNCSGHIVSDGYWSDGYSRVVWYDLFS
jgi:hypothetical protein